MPTPDSQRLLPYVPRLAVEWLSTTPDALSQVIPGSMVFADISGFTKMSERLSRRGKIGAEEVTDVMNATFADLLAVAYDRGGRLIKFGGDALLLFFQGEAHARRAASAAFQMRRALRKRGRITTSAGSVLLRVSIGVHSGEFAFFLVGASHRELMIAGPAATRTVEMEQAANPSEIVVSAECAALLPRQTIGKARGQGFMLRSAPPSPKAPRFNAPSSVDVSALVPPVLRSILGDVESEHRNASIAFIHFDGADRLIENSIDEFARSLDELVSIVQSSAEEHGVCFLATDIDADGGKIIVTAGAPTATDSDEELLLRTARAIIDSGCDLKLRIGVNRGALFSGDVGASYRRTYTVMGDPVNLAARLMSRATPGSILAAPSIIDRSRTTFQTTALEPFLVKGKTEPVQALEVGAITGTRKEATRDLPFVGRDRELSLLRSMIEEVASGSGRIVEIVGEAGIGKTRLTEEARARAREFRYVLTYSEPYAISTPYFTFRKLLRELIDVEISADASVMTERLTARIQPLNPSLVPWIPLIAIVLDVAVRATPESDAIDQRFRRARISEVIGELMHALLPEPTMIVFEDGYWMDDASRELLLEVAARRASSPWLLVVTRRPHTIGFQSERGMPTTTIKLEPLSAEESSELATAAADQDVLAPQRISALIDRASGNPLFLQELVAAASEGSDSELPESIEAVVTAHIDTLAPSDRRLLRYASVLGTSFADEVVESVLSEESISIDSAAWDRLADFLGSDGQDRHHFHHAMFRDVAYEGLPFSRRRVLHRRAGEILEKRYRPNASRFSELLALHFSRAEVHDKAWEYARIAGDGAAAKYANVEAAEFYRSALDASRKLEGISADDQAVVAERLGDVCETAGLYADAAEGYALARKLTRENGLDKPELLMKEGVLRERAGKYTDALRWYARGLRTLRSSADEHEAAVKLTLASAGVRLRQGKYTDGAKLAQSVLKVTDDDAQLAHAYYLLHLAYTEMSDHRRARYRTKALPIYERLGDIRGQGNVLCNLGIDAYYEGRWGEALSFYSRSRDANERIGDMVFVGRISNNIGEILSDQGKWDEAEPVFRAFVTTCRASGYRLGVVHGTSNLARLDARAGHKGAAIRLQACLAEFEEMHAESYIIDATVRIAECAIFEGRHNDALHVAERASMLAHASPQLGAMQAFIHRVTGYANLQAGKIALAQDSFDESLRLARAANATYEQALTHEAWSRLAHRTGHHDGADHRTRAEQLFELLGVIATPRIPGI